jgi:hypothetical protein
MEIVFSDCICLLTVNLSKMKVVRLWVANMALSTTNGILRNFDYKNYFYTKARIMILNEK